MENTVLPKDMKAESLGSSLVRTLDGSAEAGVLRPAQMRDATMYNDDDIATNMSDAVHIELASNSFANIAALLSNIKNNSSLAFSKTPFIQVALAENQAISQNNEEVVDPTADKAEEQERHSITYIQQNAASTSITAGFDTSNTDSIAHGRRVADNTTNRIDIERALSNIPLLNNVSASNLQGGSGGVYANDAYGSGPVITGNASILDSTNTVAGNSNPSGSQEGDGTSDAVIIYAIVGGADAALFTIDSNGHLSLVSDQINHDQNSFDVIVSVSDGDSSYTQALVIYINNATPTNTSDINLPVISTNDAPSLINPIGDLAATEDTEFNYTVPINTFYDADAGDNLVYTASLENGGPLPNWLHFDPSDLSFSGMPLNGNVGHINVIITATDPHGESTSDIFTITIGNTNDAPEVANPISDQIATEGDLFSIIVPDDTFIDEDAGDELTYTATLENGDQLPSWLTFDPSTLSFSGTPDSGDIGNINVIIIATDSEGASTSDIFTIAVNTNANGASVITGDTSGSGNEDTAITGTLNATDPDGVTDGTIFSVTGAAANGTATIDAATGAWSYTPNADYNGTDSFTVTVTDDDGNTTTQLIAITVNSVNDAPVITSNGGGATAAISIAENGTAVTTVTSTDPDAGASKTYSIVAVGDGALFSINSSTGVLTFNSAPNYEAPTDAGANNVYDVTVQVSDGTLTDTQAITVTVTDVVEVNSPPVADDSAISVVEGVQNTALGLLAPTDVDGDSLTITVTCLPTYGTVTLADGTAVTNGQVLTSAELTGLQYDAPAASAYNNQAVSNFTYTVFDGTNTVTGSTTITVNDSSEIGPLVADTATAAEGYWTASGSTSTTTISTVAWSASPTTDSNARNMNLQLDPAYNETKSISTSSVGATGLVTVTADPSHTASISMRVDVDGFSAGDVAKFELINSATGEVVQTINWTLIGSNDDWTITFGSAATNLGSKIVSSGVGIDASGTYYIKFTETDNTNNGSDSTADLKGTIDEIRGITQYTGTTQTITVSAPGVTWNPATNATGNVITNDTQGAEGAMVTTVTSAVVASGVTVDADGVDIAGTYGVLHIASNGAYTYTPNSDDHPTGASDVFTYTLTQPDGDSASTTLTVSLTNHTYGGTYDDTDNLTITGDGSANTLYGGGGDDTIHGGDGNDIVLGGPGNDTLYGDAGQDHLIGGTGNDTLYAGTSSSDTNATSSSMLEGGDGADSLYGTGGSDYLLGGAGNDILVGNGGNDILVGGTGSDTLTGGAGVDVFQYLLGDLSASSTDTITDFKVATYASDGDILDISDVLQGTHPTTGATLVSGGYLTFGTITYAGGNTSFTLSIDPDGSSGSTYGSTPLATFTNMTGFGSLQTGAQILQSMLDNGELKI